MTQDKKQEKTRWYDDACGTAHALELVGERWALLIIRELIFGPRRFSELRAGLPGISANVLTQRLHSLEEDGLVTRRDAPAGTYELTPWGYESEPVFSVLGRWAVRSPRHDPALNLSAASILLSFRTMLDRSRAADFSARIGLRFGTDAFVASFDRGELTIRREPHRDVAVSIAGTPAALGAVVYGGRKLPDAIADGSLVVEGDRAVARRFVSLFKLPPKATAAQRE